MDEVYETACQIITEGMRHIQTNTRKGKCVKCGECCSNFLPLSNSEIERLRAYIAEHRIPLRDHEPDCPFLSPEKRCTVYEMRPLICRVYRCNLKSLSYRDFQLMLKEARLTVNVMASLKKRVY